MTEYTEQDFKDSLTRAFKDASPGVYLHFDGHSARTPFLRDCWNYAIDNGWLKVETIELEQETFMKGYLTDKGRSALWPK